MIKCCGNKVRTGDIFGQKNLWTGIKKVMDRGFTGVSNIFSQHKPLLEQILDNILKGKLLDSEYPFASSNGAVSKDKPRDVIVFIVGGTTYEELLTVLLINSNQRDYLNQKVILGSTFVHNSTTFLDDVAQFPH